MVTVQAASEDYIRSQSVVWRASNPLHVKPLIEYSLLTRSRIFSILKKDITDSPSTRASHFGST